MMNAMVMSVLERTREIGTLRAVGWSRRRVVPHDPGRGGGAEPGRRRGRDRIGVGLTELAERAPGSAAFMEGAYSTGMFIQGLVTALMPGRRRAAPIRPGRRPICSRWRRCATKAAVRR